MRMLGAELSPRVIRHSGLFNRYADHRKGLSASAGPAARSAAMQAMDAEYTLEDWESPDLQRVLADISMEKKYIQRRERAAALIAALARAWENRFADRTMVTAAYPDYSWQRRGDLRAYWLWAAGNVEWLEDTKGTKRRPCDLRLRTPAAVAIYGSDGANYVRTAFHTATQQQVLEALGVKGDLRAQMGLGADAVDGEGRFFELKVYLHGEPNSIQLTDSEVKRAASTPKFYLVIVSQLEGEQAQPCVRVILDPLRQLDVSGNGAITLTNVKHATSLVFNYEQGVEAAMPVGKK